jgi:methionyl-tRNA formyltransferase
MDAGLDTGPVLARAETAIAPQDDAGSLHDRLAQLGAGLMVEVLRELAAGRAQPAPQPQAGATYARKIDKRETHLDWTRPAVELERAVRAFRPSPGAVTRFAGESIKIWQASVVERPLAPGALAPDLVVGCGEGALQILELQRAGGRRLPAAEFLRGHPVAPDTRLG